MTHPAAGASAPVVARPVLGREAECVLAGIAELYDDVMDCAVATPEQMRRAALNVTAEGFDRGLKRLIDLGVVAAKGDVYHIVGLGPETESKPS